MSSKFALVAVCLVASSLLLSGCSDSRDAPPPVERDSSQFPAMGGQAPSRVPAQGQDAREALIAEYQQIQQRLGQVQQEAMADTVMQQMYAMLEVHINEEMNAVDPDYEKKSDKLKTRIINI